MVNAMSLACFSLVVNPAGKQWSNQEGPCEGKTGEQRRKMSQNIVTR